MDRFNLSNGIERDQKDPDPELNLMNCIVRLTIVGATLHCARRVVVVAIRWIVSNRIGS